MRRTAIVANPARQGVGEAVRGLLAGLAERGVSAVLDPPLLEALGLEGEPLRWEELTADLVLSLGGDGTLLHAARRLAGRPIPILGVDLGGLGFLTSVSPDALWTRLDGALAGREPVEWRMTLAAEVVRGEEVVCRHHALNDAVIHKGGALRTLTLRLDISGEELGAYVADGMIVSTPTGSTGYNLSADGPLAVPDLDVVLLTPICAHTLAIRPIVTDPDRPIDLRVEEGGEGMLLVLDGQVVEEVATGDVVRVSRGDHRVPLAGVDTKGYFGRLREKLMWGGRSSRGAS